MRPNCLVEPVLSQSLPKFILQLQLCTDSLRRHKEPAGDSTSAFRCTQTAAQREKVLLSAIVPAAEFDPGIAGSVGVTTHQKIPFNALRGVRIRLETMRRSLSLEEKRKLESEHTGFAGAIISAEQQAAVL